jgi:hypothetical protein
MLMEFLFIHFFNFHFLLQKILVLSLYFGNSAFIHNRNGITKVTDLKTYVIYNLEIFYFIF